MGLLSGQLRSVIEWTDPDPAVLFLKWTADGDEIKHASKLIVGPGLGCLFVYEGRVQGVYDKEGLVSLTTENIPFWTSVTKVLQKMESEHKVGIFYYRRAEMPNVRWGTPAPIKYMDPVYSFPVGLGAFGNFSVRIIEAEAFFKNIVAGADIYSVRDLQKIIVSRITPLITDVLGKSKLAYVDIDGQRSEISAAVAQAVLPVFKTLGFELTDFRIEGTSFDEETQGRIGKIADMTAAAHAARAAGMNVAQMQQLEAMKDAAKQPATLAGAAMGLTAGMGLSQIMSGATAPAPVNDVAAKLTKLKGLFDAGLITEPEFAAKKKELLEAL